MEEVRSCTRKPWAYTAATGNRVRSRGDAESTNSCTGGWNGDIHSEKLLSRPTGKGHLNRRTAEAQNSDSNNAAGASRKGHLNNKNAEQRQQ